VTSDVTRHCQRRMRSAGLLAAILLCLQTVLSSSFLCCSGNLCTGGKSNDATTCAALNDLYAANPALSSVNAPWHVLSSADFPLDYCNGSGNSALNGLRCDTTGALTQLCVSCSCFNIGPQEEG